MFAWLLILLTCCCQKSPDVILVTIDGTRWQEVYNGSDVSRDGGHHLTPRQIVPNLYNSFVDQGIAVGKTTPMIATGPNHISLPGYLEITRGHPSTDCQTNTCDPTIDQSVFWFFQKAAVFSSWSTISKTIPTNAHVTMDTGGGAYYRPDGETEEATLAYLMRNNPDFLWVSLGDTDEWAHHNSYDNYLKSLHSADKFIGDLVKLYPNSTIIVTVDHGRSKYFSNHGPDKESERVWLMMRGPNVPHKGFVKTQSVSLSNIFSTITDVEFDSHSPQSILSRIQNGN